jgi:hypothetical protein
VRLLLVGWPTIGWNEAAAVGKDAVISSGIIVNGVMKSRRYEEEHEW